MYFATIYCTDHTIHLWPAATREECEEKLLNLLKDRKVYDRVDRTTIIKREVQDGQYVFGSPESLNIKAKFDKLRKRGQIEFDDQE